ncbi:MAG TPA: SUF system NifU family Fe-S cluster assembly protein [Myxococcaceae bacterium]|nr:SUF system NifU family Fe-S cluster assembly protein [Myxococcaceae bacterium]
MTPELRDLYQEVVLEHARKPRNFRRLDRATHRADGVNPLCGDEISLELEVDGDVVKETGFQGKGCAISRASASLMTSEVKGRSRRDVDTLFERMHALLTAGPSSGVDADALGKLSVLSGVWEFPARVKCASLAWHTLRAALEGKGITSTE